MITEHKMCFDFLLQRLSETFFILIRTEREMIKNIQYICLHVKYPLFLSDFNESWILSAVFKKIAQI